MALRVEIYVKPRASTSRVLGLRDGRLDVAVAAAPVDGAANDAVVACVAAFFDVGVRAVRIARGHTSRRKLLEVDGVTDDDLADRLRRLDA